MDVPARAAARLFMLQRSRHQARTAVRHGGPARSAEASRACPLHPCTAGTSPSPSSSRRRRRRARITAHDRRSACTTPRAGSTPARRSVRLCLAWARYTTGSPAAYRARSRRTWVSARWASSACRRQIASTAGSRRSGAQAFRRLASAEARRTWAAWAWESARQREIAPRRRVQAAQPIWLRSSEFYLVVCASWSLGADGASRAAIANEKRRRRRESHNAVERRRRDNINEKISELATLIPECLLDPNGLFTSPRIPFVPPG
jgi:hypothetical protein